MRLLALFLCLMSASLWAEKMPPKVFIDGEAATNKNGHAQRICKHTELLAAALMPIKQEGQSKTVEAYRDLPFMCDMTETLPLELMRKEVNIEFLNWSRELMVDYVENLNDGVDSFFMGAFFDDELVGDESSGSSGRIYLTTRNVEGEEGVYYKVGFSLKLVLPKTRDRFKLLIETDENEDGDGQKENDFISTANNVTYSTAIRIELHESERWRSSLDNGVRWAGEPVYFSRLRTRRTDYFGTWRTRILQTFYWRTDVEWGASLDTSILKPLDLRRHFRGGFNADYLVSDDVAQLEASAAIFDEINARSAMLYQLAAFGDTESLTKVNEYVLSFTYRRKIYRQFIFAEIVPEVAWPRERFYDSTRAINLRLEMIFGPTAY